MANEKRLIDAHEIEDLFYKQVEFGATDLMDAFDDALQDAQTVDAVEVVHGRWIEKKLDDFRMWELKCSQCGWIGISNYDAYDEPYDFNYCPNCGAKMDGERKDNGKGKAAD